MGAGRGEVEAHLGASNKVKVVWEETARAVTGQPQPGGQRRSTGPNTRDFPRAGFKGRRRKTLQRIEFHSGREEDLRPLQQEATIDDWLALTTGLSAR